MSNYTLGPDWAGYQSDIWNAGQAPMMNGGGMETPTQTPFSYNWGVGFDPAQLAAIGYSGPDPLSYDMPTYVGDNQQGGTGAMNGYTDAFKQFLASKGITPRIGSGENGYASGFFGPDGQQIGPTKTWGEGSDDAFGLAFLLGSAGAGAAAAGAGTGAVGAGGASSGGGSTGALGAGAGYTVPGAGGSLGVGGAAGGGAAAAGGAAGGGSAAGGLLGSGGVLGTGLSMGNVGSLVGAAAGLLGNGTGLNSATQTTQNKIDPRIAAYLFGTGTGGLLGSTAQLYDQQMATGGLNDLQRQGIAQQQAVLQDPNYAQGFTAMKGAGMGLLNSPVAGNPFTSGQMQLRGPGVQGLMQAGAQAVPRMTIQQPGLLGRQ